MGIPKLYEHIGRGERVSLAALAAQHFEKHGRRLRLAVDASIWLFQVKMSQGGVNPELRTIYFRLVRLLRLGIDPVFVFDGPERPSWKRGKQVAVEWESHRAVQARQMLDLFGMVHHRAPGEAEAECAFLQLERIVDVVLSEDSDTLMFGANLTIRNWSGNERRGSKEPTHVDLYRASVIKQEKGISREGMVLVALMSGGDYDGMGIKGCGATIAYEAAKAKFGDELFRIWARNPFGIADWRENLKNELRSNKSGHFSKRYRQVADTINDAFPQKAIMDSYFGPRNSSQDHQKIAILRENLGRSRKVDITELRAFLSEKLGWTSRGGALKYIRGLAPAMLTTALLAVSNRNGLEKSDSFKVCGERTHISSDGIPELKIEIRPIDLVPIDLDAEPIPTQSANTSVTISLISDDEGLDIEDTGDKATDPGPAGPRARQRRPFDPNALLSLYIARAYIEYGSLSKIDEFEREKQLPKPKSPRKPRTKNVLRGTGMKSGALNGYFNVSKSTSSQEAPGLDISSANPSLQSSKSAPEIASKPVQTASKKQKTAPKEKIAISSSVTPWTMARGTATDTLSKASSQFRVPRSVAQLASVKTATPVSGLDTSHSKQQLPVGTFDAEELSDLDEVDMANLCRDTEMQPQSSFTWDSSQDLLQLVDETQPQDSAKPASTAPAAITRRNNRVVNRSVPAKPSRDASDVLKGRDRPEIEVIDLSQDVP